VGTSHYNIADTKDLTMPDLKSELAKLQQLHFDDEPTSVKAVIVERDITVTNTGKILQFISDHPGSTRAQVSEAMKERYGISPNNTGSMMSQMEKKAFVSAKGTPKRYYRSTKEYHPDPDNKALAAARQRLAEKKAAGLIKPKSKYHPVTPLPAVQHSSMSLVVDQMPVGQARQLYDELKKIFGDKS
jgi:uncharacterized protein (DUF2249 family)